MGVHFPAKRGRHFAHIAVVAMIIKEVPKHEMARCFTERDEIAFGEFQIWCDADGKNMMHSEILRPAADFTGRMLG